MELRTLKVKYLVTPLNDARAPPMGPNAPFPPPGGGGSSPTIPLL